MTSCLCQLNRQEDALPYSETLMTLAPPGHTHHPLACLWRGITLYQTAGLYTEEIMGLLKTAYDAGIPLATKYMMHAYSGINSTLCEIKWADPKAFLTAARKFKQQKEQHFTNLRKVMPADPLTLPVKQQMLHEYRIQTGIKEMVYSEEPFHQFNKLICELMNAPEEEIPLLCEKIEETIAEYTRTNFKSP